MLELSCSQGLVPVVPGDAVDLVPIKPGGDTGSGAPFGRYLRLSATAILMCRRRFANAFVDPWGGVN